MAEDFSDRTQTFSIETPQKLDMQQVLVQVYDALKEKAITPSARSWDIFSRKIPHTSPRTTTHAASSARSTAMSC